MELRYAIVLRRVVGGHQEQLAQRWAYLVRDIDDAGRATLEGRLIGAGGRISGPMVAEDSQAQAQALHQARQGRLVGLRIGIDGRLSPSESSHCGMIGTPQAPCFDEQIGHHLLAATLPRRRVAPHESWSDPELTAPFERLLPAHVSFESSSSNRIVEIDHDDRGLPLARLATSGRVRPESGPSFHLEGSSAWDPILGRLRERSLTATLAGASADGPGVLHLHLRYLG